MKKLDAYLSARRTAADKKRARSFIRHFLPEMQWET